MDLRRIRTLVLALCLDIELEVIEVPKRADLAASPSLVGEKEGSRLPERTPGVVVYQLILKLKIP